MTIKFNGKDYEVSLTIGGVKIYCKEMGCSLMQFSSNIQKLDVDAVQTLLYAGMVGACQKAKTTPDFTMEEVKNEIDGWDFNRLQELITTFTGMLNEGLAKNDQASPKEAVQN